MKESLHRICCIQCGHKLLGATPNSIIEINCPKCKNYLHITVSENSVQITKLAQSDQSLNT